MGLEDVSPQPLEEEATDDELVEPDAAVLALVLVDPPVPGTSGTVVQPEKTNSAMGHRRRRRIGRSAYSSGAAGRQRGGLAD